MTHTPLLSELYSSNGVAPAALTNTRQIGEAGPYIIVNGCRERWARVGIRLEENPEYGCSTSQTDPQRIPWGPRAQLTTFDLHVNLVHLQGLHTGLPVGSPGHTPTVSAGHPAAAVCPEPQTSKAVVGSGRSFAERGPRYGHGPGGTLLGGVIDKSTRDRGHAAVFMAHHTSGRFRACLGAAGIGAEEHSTITPSSCLFVPDSSSVKFAGRALLSHRP